MASSFVEMCNGWERCDARKRRRHDAFGRLGTTRSGVSWLGSYVTSEVDGAPGDGRCLDFEYW